MLRCQSILHHHLLAIGTCMLSISSLQHRQILTIRNIIAISLISHYCLPGLLPRGALATSYTKAPSGLPREARTWVGRVPRPRGAPRLPGDEG